MDNYTMNVNKLLKSVLPGINEGYGHETPDNVSADQNRAIDALAQLGYTFNSWSASSNPEHEGKSMAAAMMSKKDRGTTMYAEIEPDGSINGEPLDEWIEKYFVKNSNEEAAEEKEDPEMKRIGIGKADLAAVNVAQKLATKPGALNLPFIGAQAQMNNAYGDMMKKIARKVKTIANKI